MAERVTRYTPESRRHDELLEAARRVLHLRQQATAGPWEPYDNYLVMPTVGAVLIETDNPMRGDSSNDTAFLAACSRDVEPILRAYLRADRIVAGMRKWLTAERLSWQKEAASGGREYRERAASNRDTCARMLAELARLEREP